MKNQRLIALILLLVLLLSSCTGWMQSGQEQIASFSTESYTVLEDNIPDFTEQELTTRAFERYAPHDLLGRCGVAMACIGTELMPTEERGSIGQIKPSGWHTVKYDHVDGKYLYNRCHLIGFQLAGENANEQNLITGTRYMNTEGMLPFENMVADYVKETQNHVLYRVTPDFQGAELVARGVRMEALSIEDDGKGICFDVYVYNVQPGVVIDYATGNSRLSEQSDAQDREKTQALHYVLNTNTKKFHLPTCASVKDMKETNKAFSNDARQTIVDAGYSPCGQCKP